MLTPSGYADDVRDALALVRAVRDRDMDALATVFVNCSIDGTTLQLAKLVVDAVSEGQLGDEWLTGQLERVNDWSLRWYENCKWAGSCFHSPCRPTGCDGGTHFCGHDRDCHWRCTE